MPKRAITTPAVFEPPGGGNYSPAFDCTGGRTIYVAGMTARDEKGELVGEGDAKAQTRQVLENMKAVLEAAGASMSDVVKITVFIKNLADSNAIREVRMQYFSKPYPASTLVQITSLADPRFLVEIEAIAVVG